MANTQHFYWKEQSGGGAPSPGHVIDSLWMYWDAGNVASYPGSGTVVNDISTNNNSGIFTGNPSWNSAGYFELNGNNGNFIQTSNFLPTAIQSGEFTIEIWVNPLNISNRGVIGGWGDNSTNRNFELRVENLDWQVHLYVNETPGHTPNSATSNAWHQVAASHNQSTNEIRVFANGTFLVNSFRNLTFNLRPFLLGRATYLPTSRSQTGHYAIVRIYTKVLSDSEVNQNFNANRSRFGI